MCIGPKNKDKEKEFKKLNYFDLLNLSKNIKTQNGK